MFRRPRLTPIGLDIGTRRVKAVQARMVRGGISIAASACITRQTPDVPLLPVEAARIVGTLRRQGFVGARAVVGMPSDLMLTGVLDMPPRSSGAPLDMIARQELARTSKCDSSRLELAWWELPGSMRAGEGTHALAMGCRHEDALPLLDALEQAGLDAEALDAGPTALARAVAPLAGSPPALTASLDLGWSSAQLLILHGRALVYERSIRELGIRQLHRQLHEQRDIESDLADYLMTAVGCAPAAAPQPDDAGGLEQAEEARAVFLAYADSIANELRVSMSYAQRRSEGTLARVLITGGGAEVPGVAERIAQRAGVEAKVVRADQLAEPGAGLAGNLVGPCAVCALGLALHGLGAPMVSVQEARA